MGGDQIVAALIGDEGGFSEAELRDAGAVDMVETINELRQNRNLLALAESHH
jgi:16S rRNA U1498 N3-methylase RsmE